MPKKGMQNLFFFAKKKPKMQQKGCKKGAHGVYIIYVQYGAEYTRNFFQDEYLDHQVIKQFKAPYVSKIREVNSSFGLAELDFIDKRNTSKMHTHKLRKYFNGG